MRNGNYNLHLVILTTTTPSCLIPWYGMTIMTLSEDRRGSEWQAISTRKRVG